MLKTWLLILIPCIQLQAQSTSCVLKEPIVTINFGVGDATEMNASASGAYRRIDGTCPRDGHYTYTPYTSDCFRGDWITLEQDHTAGDIMGNMLLVNASYQSGEFFSTMARGLKPGTMYEFAVWMLNVCKPSEKCPFPLLPNITIRIETVTGQLVTQLNTGELQRYGRAQWTKYNIMFKLPAGVSNVAITMVNHAPGGCGNDFAIDDITFRECVPPPPPPITKANTPAKSNTTAKTTTRPPPASTKPATTTAKAPVKKEAVATTKPPAKKPDPKPVVKTVAPTTDKKDPVASTTTNANTKTVDSTPAAAPTIKASAPVFRPPPPILTSRTNSLVKRIETDAGDIKIDLYDNGEIDGDTVTIYHNNKLLVSRARLTQKALTLVIKVSADEPHHELVMVANNLGSIPPNTSLMVVTAGSKRYEVFISSNEQNNAKVVFDLK